MKNILHLLSTLLMFAGAALGLSAFFSAFQWLFNIFGWCSEPSWGKFFFGAIGLFIFFIILGVWNVIKNWDKIKNQ